MLVYRIVNKLNGKHYIGQTRQKLSVRFNQHCRSNSNCRLLYRAINKHGRENFHIETLGEYGNTELLSDAEVYFISFYDCMAPNGYNSTSGGEGNYIRSLETRKLLSDAGRGKGRPHTAASKKKLSEAKLGANNPMFGRKTSDEVKAKISASLKGRKRPVEVIAKIKANHNSKSDLNLTCRRKPNAPQAS